MEAAKKARLRFAKEGDLRLVGHQDLMRLLERLLRRATIPTAKSLGFNPRPKIVLPSALALGIEGRREVLELELTDPLPPAEVLGRLAAVSPPGLVWLEAEALADGARAPRVVSASYQLPIPTDRRAQARAAIDSLLAAEHRSHQRKKRNGDRSTIDLRPFVLELRLTDDGILRLRLRVAPEGSARPEDVLESLALRDLLDSGAILVRADVELDSNPTKAPLPDPEIMPNALPIPIPNSNPNPYPYPDEAADHSRIDRTQTSRPA